MQTQTVRHHLRIFMDICMLKGSYLSSQVDLCTSCPSLAPHIIAPLWRQPHTGVGWYLGEIYTYQLKQWNRSSCYYHSYTKSIFSTAQGTFHPVISITHYVYDEDTSSVQLQNDNCSLCIPMYIQVPIKSLMGPPKWVPFSPCLILKLCSMCWLIYCQGSLNIT